MITIVILEIVKASCAVTDTLTDNCYYHHCHNDFYSSFGAMMRKASNNNSSYTSP